ncbi:MAG: ORF6N domain-containing protein [Chloroflexi bacterium]|nr:ORF6N domain-containing protein [Chloroflexota bacterium]
MKRNQERFPPECMFRLIDAEKRDVVTVCDHIRPLRFSHRLPSAFTEHGAIMAANVLNSARAIQASVAIVKALVAMRRALASHRALTHAEYDRGAWKDDCC